MLYPLKFRPIYKDKIWGGDKIRTILGKDFSPLPNCGESWEISGIQGEVSVVSEGFLKDNSLEELIEIYMGDLVGDKVFEKFGTEFPLLIKFIHANDDLSIQVHPDDALASQRHNAYGKTEMWYVIDAEPGAKLISGFNKKLDPEIYLQHLKNKTLPEILNFEICKKDDVFFIPAGRVHAICKGILLAEIQQTSDITYRIYDWDRKDAQGEPRELHTDLALDAIDFNHTPPYKTTYKQKSNSSVSLAVCEYFSTQLLEFNKTITKDLPVLDSFIIYIGLEGTAEIACEDGSAVIIRKGETVLVPAEIHCFSIVPQPSAKLLEVFIK